MRWGLRLRAGLWRNEVCSCKGTSLAPSPHCLSLPDIPSTSSSMATGHLSDLWTFVLTDRALEAVIMNSNPGEAFVASPPSGLDVPFLAPFQGEGDATLVDIFPVEFPVVFAAVVQAVKWSGGSVAATVVAVEGLLILF